MTNTSKQLATCKLRLSGSVESWESCSGYLQSGVFIHHPLTGTEYMRSLWELTHAASGQSFLCRFVKLANARACALAISATYDVNASAEGLIEQFKSRGSQPSIADLYAKFED